MTDLADPYLDIELFVESQWRAISNARLTDREVEALGDEVAVQEAHLAQVRDPSHLRVEKVVRVVHDVLQIRFAEAHALPVAERERLHAREVTRLARSLLPCAA